MPFEQRRTLEGQRDWLKSVLKRIDDGKLTISESRPGLDAPSTYRDEVVRALRSVEMALE
jgi:hypothetical protein